VALFLFFFMPLPCQVFLSGRSLSFLPLQERPLEEWVIAFFRSVYAPTIYKWGYVKAAPVFIPEQEAAPSQKPAPKREAPTESKVKLAASTGDTFLKNLEEGEESILGKITNLFGQVSQVARPAPPPPPEPIPQPDLPPILPSASQNKEAREDLSKPKQKVPLPPSPAQAGVDLGKRISVGQTLIANPTDGHGQKAEFSSEAAPPIAPTQPNLIVGQVMDANQKIVEGAILEIKDPLGRPVRALKTNKAGHFLIVTPLNNGKYKIFIEKEGLNFEPLELEAGGSVIPPIAIKAKNALAKVQI
jgi:hypothetical protein